MTRTTPPAMHDRASPAPAPRPMRGRARCAASTASRSRRLASPLDDALLEPLRRTTSTAVAFAAPVADLAARDQARADGRPPRVRRRARRAALDGSCQRSTTLARRRERADPVRYGRAGRRAPRLRAQDDGRPAGALAPAIPPRAAHRRCRRRVARRSWQSPRSRLCWRSWAATPARVSAFAPRVDDESGAAGRRDAHAGVRRRAGGPHRRQPGRAAGCASEIAVACDGRTIVLDALDARAPLQIHAANRHHGPEAGGLGRDRERAPGVRGRATAPRGVASSFVSAARARDASAATQPSSRPRPRVWEKARESMARGGELLGHRRRRRARRERPVACSSSAAAAHRVEAARRPSL